MSNHLLILLVVIPLMAAPLCLLLRQQTLVRLFVTLVTLACLIISGFLFFQLYHSSEVIKYAIGGWAAPLGIEYRMDKLSAIVVLIISFIAFMIVLYDKKSIANEIPKSKVNLYYTAYLLCTTGLLGISITGDAFNLFVFLEISSLSSYALISLGKHRTALLAAFRYLIMGTLGASFVLIGIGLLYAHTGTLNIYDLGGKLEQLTTVRTVFVAFVFIIIGLAIKIALFPFHLWLPKAYSYSPTTVSALLAGTATKVAIYALIRFLAAIFGLSFSFSLVDLDTALLALSIAAILYGSFKAILQTDLKLLLAYSSIAQIGYMVLGISLASNLGLQAGIIHIFNHALIKTTLFLLIGCFVLRLGSSHLSQLQGIAKNMPVTAAGIVIAGLSLIGVPLTAGFVSKWYLVLAALEQNLWWLVVIILFSSLLAVVYIWKIVETLYFKTNTNTIPSTKEAPLGMLIPIGILVLANIYFGIETSINVGMADAAATQIWGSKP